MRLLIDLTDLAAWSGPFTGIEQTVFNLASRYADRPDVGFFVFDGVERRFSSIEFEQVRRHLEGRDTRIRSRWLTAAHQAFDRLPLAIRDLIPSQASRRVRRVLEHALHVWPARDERIPFTQDCVVLAPGEGWHDAGMLPELCKLKRQIGFRLAAVVYDLMPVFHPHLFPLGFSRQYHGYMTTLVSEASALFAISRATENDVKRFCAQERLPVPEVHVFRLGDSLTPPTAVAPETPIPPGDFILAVGLEWRKNAILLYQMLKLARQEGIALPLIAIAGRPSWIRRNHELLESLLTRDPEIRGQVQILTGLDDSRLAWLYRNCRFTVFPSVCEGWGLPVAESLRYGKLCLASSASSIPEVGGDLVEYASPFDPRGFLDLVCRYLDPQRLAERETQIRARYRPQDWDESFARFDGLLRRALGSPRTS
jgi:glycosyltransferase involved in cell wall biosynthesis